MYAVNEYQYVIQKETTLGTPSLTDGGSETGLAVNVTGVPEVMPGASRQQEVRNSSGRTAKICDMETEPKLMENTISFTTYLDESIARNMLENFTGNAISSTPASYDIEYNYSNSVSAGDSDTDWTGTFTFARVSPNSSGTDIYPGCIVDTFSIYGGSEDEAGRLKCDVGIKSRIVPILNADASSWTITAYACDEERYITDLAGASAVRTIESLAFTMESLRIDMTSGVKFYGFDTDGDPEVINRGMPEMAVNIDVGMAIDSTTDAFKDYMIAQDTLDLLIHNDAWASATLGVKADYCTVRDSFNIEEVKDGAFFTLPLKATASTSGNLIQVVI